MNLRNRPVRVAAAVGAVLAAGTTTFMALAAGTASADEPGRCTQNVNVREDPDSHAKIVALCERGKQVKLGEERDGFVHLEELGGWASKDYVKADDSSSDEHGGSADDHHSADDSSNDNSNDGSNDSSGDTAEPAHHAADQASHRAGNGDGQGNDSANTSGDAAGGLGGLLG
jgi:hypothetical protein